MEPDQYKKCFRLGETIMRQGDIGKCAYIIESGRVEIRLEKPNGDVQIVGTRGPGTMIGEMSLVDHAPRTATVQALEPCVLLEISEEDFSRRLAAADPVLRMTTQVILTRYRDTLTRANITKESQDWQGAESTELNCAAETHALENIKIANDFQIALNNEQLHLHYQPIVNLKNGKLVGFEALIRWQHPEQGLIPPDIFIPIIEENGLIVIASQWVLNTACKALKQFTDHDEQYADLFMSVNFTSKDFCAPNFLEMVLNTARKHRISTSQLHLEITERLLMAHPGKARKTLMECHQAGIHISIDDFGTGYSSLSYLNYFPIDALKIDRHFVSQMCRDDNAMILIKSIIALGQNMNLSIIAEGVETIEEANCLVALGCDLAQGYYYSRPMPEEKVIAFLHDHKSQLKMS